MGSQPANPAPLRPCCRPVVDPAPSLAPSTPNVIRPVSPLNPPSPVTRIEWFFRTCVEVRRVCCDDFSVFRLKSSIRREAGSRGCVHREELMYMGGRAPVTKIHGFPNLHIYSPPRCEVFASYVCSGWKTPFSHHSALDTALRWRSKPPPDGGRHRDELAPIQCQGRAPIHCRDGADKHRQCAQIQRRESSRTAPRKRPEHCSRQGSV